MKIFVFNVSHIKWDTYDEETGKAPSAKSLGLPTKVEELEISADTLEEATEKIADKLSDEYGYLVEGYTYEVKAELAPPAL